MHRKRILLAALLAALIVSIVAIRPSNGETAASASCATITYSAVDDFSTTSNPNGPWSYGWEASLGGAFTLNAGERSVYQGLDTWEGPEGMFEFNFPLVSVNHTGATLDYAVGVSQPASMLNLHPSFSGKLSVLRWTAPTNGSFLVAGLFQGIDTRGTSSDVHVLLNSSTSLLSANINGFGNQSAFNFTRDLVAGDTLDFVVGWGYNNSFYNDNTGLSVTITDGAEFSCADMLPDTVSWWRAEGNANDFFGRNNGMLKSGATFAPGIEGQAFSMNGGYVEVPDSPSVSITGPMTLEAWIKLNANNIQQAIIEKYDVPGRNGYYFRVSNAGKLEAAVCSPSICASPAVGGTMLTTGVWHHVAAVYDGTDMRIYLDGHLDGSLRMNQVPTDGPTTLKIGARGDDANTRLGGLIDEVRIFNRALTPCEIANIANRTCGTDTTPPTVSCPAPVSASADNNCQARVPDVLAGVTASGGCGGPVTLSQSPAAGTLVGLGTTTITVTATDATNNSATCTTTFTVTDNTPPQFAGSPTVDQPVLWSPDHKMVDVTVNYAANDNCSAAGCTLSVTSNEPINGTGDGDMAPDWEIVDAHHVRLRAERAGTGSGRIYTIMITCVDATGNSSSRSVTVNVPKSQK
jgi:hypothetical protein